MSREYKDVNPNRLVLPGIGLALLGVVLAYFNELEIGLTLLFFGALFIFGLLIYQRLHHLGAEKWAIGSIIVWFGFFLSSLPLFGYAWKLMSTQTQIILFVFGLIFIGLGFLTEFFDLNQKLINLIKQTKIRLTEIITRIKARLLSSVWTFTMFISVMWLILSFLISEILVPLEILTSFSDLLSPRLFLSVVFVFSLIMEIRELILLFFTSFANGFYLLLLGLGRRIIQIRDLLISFYKALIGMGKKAIEETKNMINLLISNNYSLGFLGFIVFGVLSFFNSDSELFALSNLMLFAGLTTLLIQKPSFIADTVSSIHHNTYRQSLRFRNRFTRTQSFECPNCDESITDTFSYCVKCNFKLPVCSVCRNQLLPGEEIMQCPHCEQSGHVNHLDRWLRIKAVCPNCRIAW